MMLTLLHDRGAADAPRMKPRSQLRRNAMERLTKFACAIFLTLGTFWALSGATALAQPAAPNYQGLWWAAPAGSQPGWGINLAHQGDIIFATWFTYSSSDPRWFFMQANKAAEGVYSGTLVQNIGPSYASSPFDSTAVRPAPFTTGTATLTFDSPTTGTVTYKPGGTVIVQPITLQAFGPLPTCVWGAQADLSKATNYTDLWWASPPGSESGWGVNLTHQGTTIFATWFTYGGSGVALWFSATAPQTGPNTFSGTLYRTSGPAWGSLPYDSNLVGYTTVGEASFVFTDGNAGRFTYSVNSQGGGGSAYQIKSITRQVFREPGTVCH
jgi:hypothetical protein